MNLVFLYGPPSAGKYTVGKALAEITGYAFLHNHLTVDLVRVILPDDETGPRHDLIQKIRYDMLAAAAKENVDTIFTFAYSGEVDDEWIETVVKAVESVGAQICFVQLHPPQEVLFSRIENASRVEMGKVCTIDGLKHRLEVRDHYATVKHSNNLFIDTSQMEPTESAQKIAQHFGLIP